MTRRSGSSHLWPVYSVRGTSIYRFPTFLHLLNVSSSQKRLSAGISLSRKPSDTPQDDYLPHACHDPCPCHVLLGFFSMRTVTSRRAMTAIYLWPQSQAQCQARVNTSSQWLRTWRITAEGLLGQGAAGEVTGKDESGVGKTESRSGGIVGNKMSVSFPGNVRVCTGWPSQHVM